MTIQNVLEILTKTFKNFNTCDILAGIMIILGIETSCDETATAVIEAKGDESRPAFEILSNVVSSQVKIHRPFGGIVPNLAKRAHQENLTPVLKQSLKKAKLFKKNPKQIPNTRYQILNTILEREDILRPKVIKFLRDCKKPAIDAIAVTLGPGLAPALWPGVNFARALAYFWQKPIIGVNHLEGHLFSAFLAENRKNNFGFRILNFEFPAVALLVSGGHTQLILMKELGKYKLIGETRDDAAGECFDKTARILGLGYPGGPAIAATAEKYLKSKIPNIKYQIPDTRYQIKLPRPMINTKDYDFSFSGLKTAVLYLVNEIEKSQKLTNEIRAAIAAEIQQAVIDVLISKTIKAAKNFRAKTVMLSGGVAANDELRKQMNQAVNKQIPNTKCQMPSVKYCTDNAVMIAAAAYLRAKKYFGRWQNLKADANLRLA